MTAADFWRSVCAAIPCGETDLPFSLALRVVDGDPQAWLRSPTLVIVLADHDRTETRFLPDVLQVDGDARDVEDSVLGVTFGDSDTMCVMPLYRESILWVMRAVLDAAGPLRVVSIDLGPGGN